MSDWELIEVSSAAEIEAVRELFREYAAAIAVDLCFQNFERELDSLPGAYSPPRGRLLLARLGQQWVGCAGLRPLDHERAELKRMFVRPACRGRGVGQALAARLIDRAKQCGYGMILLDTLESMAAARRLYARLGFVETQPYYDNPLCGVVYMRLQLR